MDQEQVAGLEPTWAVVELMGRQQMAGLLSTITLGGSVLLKVEVPENKIRNSLWNYEGKTPVRQEFEWTTPAYVRYLGIPSVYAINPCSESVARQILSKIEPSTVATVQTVKTPLALPPPAEIEVAWPEKTEAKPEDASPVCQECGSDETTKNDAGNLECADCGALIDPQPPQTESLEASEI